MIEIVADQRSHEWHRARAGRVTGSTLERAINPKKQDTFLYELVAAMMTETIIDDLNVPAVVRGRDMEPFAIARARDDLGMEFERVGFCVSLTVPGFGLSPDIVLLHENKIVGGVETKCPNTATHLKYMINDEVPKEHKYQVWAPFIASDDVEFWYFMSYDDRCYERPTFYKKVIRADIEDDIKKCRKTLTEFIGRVKEKHSSLTF